MRLLPIQNALRLIVVLAGFFAAQILCAAQTQTPAEPTAPAASSIAAPVKGSGGIEKSVIKLFSTIRYPDFYKPWQKDAPTDYVGSGVVIPGKRILSNAHLVLYASQVQIQGDGSGDKLSATVEAVAPGIDLAVLKLDDESFFDTHPPLVQADERPNVENEVLAYGFPTGGTSLSITKGIISRIEFASYNFPVAGLRIQIDAAINHGNSGGPAVVGGKMVGLAYSTLSTSQNISYIIPCEEINLFLASLDDKGHYLGKYGMHDFFQTLENAALRAELKLPPSVKGIIIHKPYKSAPDYPLKEWDVVTKIGAFPISDQGMVRADANLSVSFKYMVQKLVKDGKVPLTLYRDGQELKMDLPVDRNRTTITPNLNGAYPEYFIYGPMVFSVATAEYVSGFARGTYGGAYMAGLMGFGSPLLRRFGDAPAFPGQELVVVPSPFFPHKITKGYSSASSEVVQSINGIPVKNLRHVVEILRDSTDKYLTIEFGNPNSETLIFPREEMLAATDDILADNGIRTQGSANMIEVWNAKKKSQ